MSSATEEVIRICENLPPEKQKKVVSFARSLLAESGDEAWERIIASPERRPKLEEFLRASREEGDEPFDETKL